MSIKHKNFIDIQLFAPSSTMWHDFIFDEGVESIYVAAVLGSIDSSSLVGKSYTESPASISYLGFTVFDSGYIYQINLKDGYEIDNVVVSGEYNLDGTSLSLNGSNTVTITTKSSTNTPTTFDEVVQSMTEHIGNAYDSIESKGGTVPEQKNLANLADSIESIDSEFASQEKTATITSNTTTTISPDSGYDGLSKVIITTNVQPTLEKKNLGTITDNGSYTIVAGEGYDGMSSLSATLDIHDIIEVDELPTSNIDTSKYYKVTGDGALYKASAVGTWVLNETLLTMPTSDTSYKVYIEWHLYNGSVVSIDSRTDENTLGDYARFSIYPKYANISMEDLGGDTKYYNSYYSSASSSWSAAQTGDYIQSAYDGYRKYVSKATSDGVNLRTFTIYGGKDSDDPELLSWLQANATLQEGGWSKYYIPRFQSKSVSPSTSAKTVTPDNGYDGLSQVIVAAAPTQTKTTTITKNGSTTISKDSSYYGMTSVTVTTDVQPALQSKTVTENGTVTADSGYDGLSSVEVDVPQLDTSDATATADSMLSGKTAYVNGEKVTGTIKTYDGTVISGGSIVVTGYTLTGPSNMATETVSVNGEMVSLPYTGLKVGDVIYITSSSYSTLVINGDGSTVVYNDDTYTTVDIVMLPDDIDVSFEFPPAGSDKYGDGPSWRITLVRAFDLGGGS